MSATVITHNGGFHCDEVLAFSLIRYLYGNVELIRTRDQKKIRTGNDVFIVDVGGVFNPCTREYDHHQFAFNESYNERSTIPLSSAGLVYKYHGDDILKKFVAENYPTLTVNIQTLKDKIYDGWIKHIDANDNGVSVCTGIPRYPISSAIYARVGRMNIRWNSSHLADRFAEEEAFLKAADVVISEFIDIVDVTVNDYFLSESIIENAIVMSDPMDKILILDCKCPWKGHISNLERKHSRLFSFIAYPEDDVKWRLHAIPTSGFMNRFVIPSHFKNLPGVTFIHKSGFIASAESFDDIMRLGMMAVEYYTPSQM